MPADVVGAEPNSGSVDASGIGCLDAALWYERSTLEALVSALSRPSSTDDVIEPLLLERRMARLLSAVETTALTAQLGHSPYLASGIGGGWAVVLDEHDAALQRLVEQVDAAVGVDGRLDPPSDIECSRLERASREQAR